MKHRLLIISPRWYAVVVLAIAFLIIFFSDKGHISGDGAVRWNALTALMEERQLTSDKYSLIQPLIAAPLYLVGDLWSRIEVQFQQESVQPDREAQRLRRIKKVVQRFNKIVIWGIAIWWYFLLHRSYLFTVKQAAWSTIFLVFGSFLIPYARDFYSECLWTALSLVILFLICRLRQQPFHALKRTTWGALIVCSSLVIPLNPVLLFVLAGLTVLLIGRNVWHYPRPREITQYLKAYFTPDVNALLIAMVTGSVLCLTENIVRRGHPLNFGYASEGFSTPFWYGLAGQLFSPTRGILFFIPTFFCGMMLLSGRLSKGEPQNFVILSLVYSGLLVLVYSTWWAWHGGLYWGPRFFLPLSVFGALYWVVLIKSSWHQIGWFPRLLIIIIAILSYAVYKAGVGINHRYLGQCLALAPSSDICFWNMRFLPYASWMNVEDIVRMVTHRSTGVEVSGILLMGLLTSFAKIKNQRTC
jgi:hypothetical protein